MTVPNGPAETATFDASNIARVSLSDGVEVSDLVFNPGTSAFTFSAKPQFTLTISGSGIMNESSESQDFVAAAGALIAGEVAIAFKNSATAGDNTRFTAKGANTMEQSGGGIFFYDASSAGSGDFMVNGGAVGNGGSSSNGLVVFVDRSTAANATFRVNASAAPGAPGGATVFGDNSTAANATIINNGAATAGMRPGVTEFDNASTAGDADLIAYAGVPGAEGGVIFFGTDSTVGTARVTVFGNGNLDISGHNPPGITIGSIQGDGIVFLGANNLTVNSSNLDNAFSGTISDHGSFGGVRGSLTKMGTGILTLVSPSTYTGGTIVSDGVLRAENKTGSATGSGRVRVNAGVLGGGGIIGGAVTLGTGSGSGAILQPTIHAGEPTTLTIQSTVTFKADGTYIYRLNTRKADADNVVANGVTIENGAQFDFKSVANEPLALGVVFTAIATRRRRQSPEPLVISPMAQPLRWKQHFPSQLHGGDGNAAITLTVVP